MTPGAEFTFDSEEMRQVFADMPRNLMYAGMNALNETSKAAQASIRARMAGRLTYRGVSRKTFMERMIRIDFWKSSSPSLEVAVFTGGPNADPERELVSKFEDQGEKKAKGGGLVAIPVGARPNYKGSVPKGLRIPELHLHKSGGGLRITGDKGTWLDQGRIYQRTGKGRGTNVKVLYVLKRETPLPTHVLNFYDQVAAAASNAWPAQADRAIAVEVFKWMQRERTRTAVAPQPPQG